MFISSISILIFVFLYKEIFYITFNERLAKLSGVPVNRINFIFTILTAVTVSISARAVGALIVSSMMVVPAACSMQLANSYKKTIIYAVNFQCIFYSAWNIYFLLSGIKTRSCYSVNKHNNFHYDNNIKISLIIQKKFMIYYFL